MKRSYFVILALVMIVLLLGIYSACGQHHRWMWGRYGPNNYCPNCGAEQFHPGGGGHGYGMGPGMMHRGWGMGPQGGYGSYQRDECVKFF
ncbi:MAG: hypothetical protein JRC86_04325, partial [Deltaproteobacteria bacterium]|nr:hypothetical protein [Deltaproteobacteria bacterium]